MLSNLYGHLWAKKRRNKGRYKVKFEKGELVRLSGPKYVFLKGYRGNWTEEVFRIREVIKSRPKAHYRVEDWSGEAVKGSFYEEELQSVEKELRNFWKVEKVLQERTRGRRKEYLVKWENYPSSMNSWVPAKDVINL